MKVNDTLIGKIFWARCEEGEEKEKYDKMRDEWSKKYDADLIEKDLLKFINSNIKDKEKRARYEKMLREYSRGLMNELSFESPFFYELGFKDGYKFYIELNEVNTKKDSNTCLYQDVQDEIKFAFNELFEKERQKLIKENEQYSELWKIRKEYSIKYPNVIRAIEDGDGDSLNKEEIDILSKIYAIDLDIDFYENILAFKLGRKFAEMKF